MTSINVMLHLGLGSFHRAHQAAYFQRLHELGDAGWTLASGNLRADMAPVEAALIAQGGAYTLETVTPGGARCYAKISAIRTVVPYDPGLAEVIRVGADAATRIVSFTVTEAGYFLDANERLDFSFPDLVADLEAARAGRPGATIYGAVTAILRARSAGAGGKLTLLCCDNLRHNGTRFRSGLAQFIGLLDDAPLQAWCAAHTSCPNAMVDRITPRPTPAGRERVLAATGWDDAAPVMSESFTQWVIEDDFCNGRPAWEKAGVQMVESVAPYEEAKIRILNASHSCVAWAGLLAGYQFIHEGMGDERIRRFAHDYVTGAVFECLQASPVDLEAYRDVVFERFANAAIGDTNLRVAMDGFSKLPGFIVPTIRERLARGLQVDSVAILPALFLLFLQRWHSGQLGVTYQDQAMDLASVQAICSAADPLAAFCAERLLWGELAGDARLLGALRGASARVQAFAAGAAV